MRLLRRLAAVLAVVLAGLAVTAPLAQASQVVRIVDGDTVHAIFHGHDRTLRLYCIDAPETRQPYGPEATAALRSAIGGQTVSVSVLRLDRYGRSVARIRINRRDVSLEMVRQGLAWDYRSLCADKRFAAAEDAARAAHLGLWASDHPINPADWRRGVR